MSDINPIIIIKDSRFSHYLIDNEFMLEINIYKNIYYNLKEIVNILDELEEMDKWYYIPLSILKDITGWWNQKSQKYKLLTILYFIGCFLFGVWISLRWGTPS